MASTSSLAGQTVLVIGGTKNIGLAICRRAAQAGASVVIAGRNAASAAAAAADLPGATGIRLDLDDESTIVAAAESMSADVQKDGILGAFQAKVVGPLLVAKHFAPRMPAGGSFLLFSGIAAWKPAAPYSVMAIANGAVQFTASSLAKELAPIRVNAISPGIIDSGAWDAMPTKQRQSFFAQSSDGALAGRVGTLTDIVDAAMWLFTAGFVSGETVHVEGGARYV